ncbi:hypothetical protein PybrP1_011137 [[Pythium] brassicae (nom. inval.)]|nr:hypothetical protein PybrP1_011137 [[Pythium] brassicae (nom. inval.)]
MASVLQAVKHKRLSDLEARESCAAFQVVAKDGEMSAKQLKMCLCALGFAVSSAEAHAFVYEFDYKSTHTIGLADFQRVYLFKVPPSKQMRLCEREADACARAHRHCSGAGGSSSNACCLFLAVLYTYLVCDEGRCVSSLDRRSLDTEHVGAIHVRDLRMPTSDTSSRSKRLDVKELARCAALQHYDDSVECAAVSDLERSVADARRGDPESADLVSFDALAAFLRIGTS